MNTSSRCQISPGRPALARIRLAYSGPKPQSPLPDRFLGDVDSTAPQDFFYAKEASNISIWSAAPSAIDLSPSLCFCPLARSLLPPKKQRTDE